LTSEVVGARGDVFSLASDVLIVEFAAYTVLNRYEAVPQEPAPSTVGRMFAEVWRPPFNGITDPAALNAK
jgi:hypothetical protein